MIQDTSLYSDPRVMELEQDRDTLISVLRECVVALGGVVDPYDTKELEEFKKHHGGCAAGEICIMDVFRCNDALTHSKSTLSKYER